jgi:hypothetical protein
MTNKLPFITNNDDAVTDGNQLAFDCLTDLYQGSTPAIVAREFAEHLLDAIDDVSLDLQIAYLAAFIEGTAGCRITAIK